MNTHADKSQENKSQSGANGFSQKKSGGAATFQFVDNRPEAVAQKKLQEMARNSPRTMQLKAFQEMANNSPQRKKADQLQAMADNYSSRQQQPIQKRENNTGLPDNLKSGIENISGYSMDDVKVHYNSDKPAQLQAHAYAQGTDIHIASGQEKHLPHEAWHVVQQKQGRVKPTVQKKGMAVNDDAGLEKEADMMGSKALLYQNSNSLYEFKSIPQAFIQRVKIRGADYDNEEIWDNVRFELETQSISEEHFPGLKNLFDSLPDDKTFDYFDEIAQELVEEYNAQNNTELGFEIPEEIESDDQPSGSSSIIFKILKILTWLLYAQVVFGRMIPVVGATPLPRSNTPDMEDDELDSLPDISPQDQLALTPITHFNITDEAPELLFPILDNNFVVPRGGTRTDTEPHQEENNEGMSLRDYIIWNIFSSRRNFGELPKVPRQDMTLADWLVNGPSWLYLPYTKFSPTELAVFVKHFHIKPALDQFPSTMLKSSISTMYAAVQRPIPGPIHLLITFLKKAILRGGYSSLKAYYNLFEEMQATNAEARSFRSDLSSDPWIKNSFRHAYWMCSYAQKWTPEFASDLGYAHEYAHLDLTIEGPFDSLIDKINNFWGVNLAASMDKSCGELVNNVGEKGYLAWAKEYERSEESGVYLPTLYKIQEPLDQLWQEFQQLPEFNEYDLNALRLLLVQLPGQKKSPPKIEEIE